MVLKGRRPERRWVEKKVGKAVGGSSKWGTSKNERSKPMVLRKTSAGTNFAYDVNFFGSLLSLLFISCYIPQKLRV